MIGCYAPIALMHHNRSRIIILLVHVVRPLRHHLILIDVYQIALIMSSTVVVILYLLVTLTLVIVDVLYLYILVRIAFQVHKMLAVRRRCHIEKLIVPVSLRVPPVVRLRFVLLIYQAALLLRRVLAIVMKKV